MRNSNFQALAALDASVNQTSAAIDAREILAASFQVVMTGSATGTVNLLASNDAKPPADSQGRPVPANWTLIPSQTVALTAGLVALIPKFDCAYQWLQVQYVKNNGSAGTVTVTMNSKGF